MYEFNNKCCCGWDPAGGAHSAPVHPLTEFWDGKKRRARKRVGDGKRGKRERERERVLA